jgi:hypothetical protein
MACMKCTRRKVTARLAQGELISLFTPQDCGQSAGSGELLFGMRGDLNLFHVRHVVWPEPVGFTEGFYDLVL